MAKNILGNLITSTNIFNRVEKKCIDVVCREDLEEDIPDNWDDTLLRCTIAANISDFGASNIPAVSHYYMTNSLQQYSNRQSSRCMTPVIPPDNNPVIVNTHATWKKSERKGKTILQEILQPI
jgi:hypothetical protein